MRKAPYPNRPKQDKELNQSPEGWQAYCKALREESQGEKQIMSEIEKIQRYRDTLREAMSRVIGAMAHQQRKYLLWRQRWAE